MTAPLLIPLPGNEAMTARLARGMDAALGGLESRHFPDGETYLRFMDDLRDRQLALVCTLDRPDRKIPALLFAAQAARELGAGRVGLIAPYLCYMRQDARFHPGEAVTSRHFARLISRDFDWLATVDPHLHRYKALKEIYGIAAKAVDAAPALATWIAAHVAEPFLIGPDEESRQWVEAVARGCGAPFAILQKQRSGDRSVRVTPPAFTAPPGATPVVVDDIISSGRTVLASLKALAPHFTRPPWVLCVHGLFADGSDMAIRAAGAKLLACNTVPGPAADIDVGGVLLPAVQALLGV